MTAPRLPLPELLVVLAAVSLTAVPLRGQSDDDLGRISLAVVTPEADAGLGLGLDASQLRSLRGKVVQMVTAHGLSGDGYDADLVIYPVLDVYDRRTAEGLRNLTVVEGELGLYVKHAAQDVTFASLAVAIQGHGRSEARALTSAIRSVRPGDARVAAFFDDARQRIADYYERECDALLQRVETLASAQLYDEAFGLAFSIPSAAPACCERAQAAAVRVFERYASQRCEAQVQAARAALADNAYGRGLRLLANVDPSSSCGSDAERLVREIAPEVDARDRRAYEAVQEAYRTAAELEHHRIDAAREVAQTQVEAARDVARAYYAHRRSPVTYATLVRTTVVR